MAKIITSYYKDPKEDEEESIAAVLADDATAPEPPKPDDVVEELAKDETVTVVAAPKPEDEIDELAKDSPSDSFAPAGSPRPSDAIDELAKEPEPKNAGAVTNAASQRAREAAYSATEDSGDDEEPGVSGWAIAADLIFNNGRGIGGIVSQAQKQKQDWQTRKARFKGSAAQQAIAQEQIGIQREQNRLRELELNTKHGEKLTDQELRDRGIDISGRRVGLQEQIHGDKSDPNSNFSTTQVHQAREKARGAATGRITATHENIDTIAGDAARKSGAQAAATQPYKKELKAMETPGLVETKRHNEVTEKTAKDNAARAEAKDERAAAKDDRENAGKLVKESEDDLKMLSSIDGLTRIYGRWKGTKEGVPGVGEVESGMVGGTFGPAMRNIAGKARKKFGDKKTADEYNADAESAAQAIGDLQAFKLHDLSGASAAEKEFQRIAGSIAKGGMSEEQTEIALGRAKQLYQQIIAARTTGNEKVGAQVVQRAGIDPSFVSPPPAAGAPAVAPPAAPPAAPQVGISDGEAVRKLRDKYSRWKVQ